MRQDKPVDLKPVLAKIRQLNCLGTSILYEVVLFNELSGEWESYGGSTTFSEGGHTVVDWTYVEDVVMGHQPFNPDWVVSHPCETLNEFLKQSEMTPTQLADEIGECPKYLKLVCSGVAPIRVPFAVRLARAGIGSAEFWMNRQSQYDISVYRGPKVEPTSITKPVVKQEEEAESQSFILDFFSKLSR